MILYDGWPEDEALYADIDRTRSWQSYSSGVADLLCPVKNYTSLVIVPMSVVETIVNS